MKKILGGKNGTLKCECGNLRYQGVKLCPQCYYSKHEWYAFKGIYEFVARSDGDTDFGIEICGVGRGVSLSHVLSKFSTVYQWVTGISKDGYKLCNSQAEAEQWVREHCDGIEYAGVKK